MHALTFCQRAAQAVTSQSLPLGCLRPPEPVLREYPFPRAANFDGAKVLKYPDPPGTDRRLHLRCDALVYLLNGNQMFQLVGSSVSVNHISVPTHFRFGLVLVWF